MNDKLVVVSLFKPQKSEQFNDQMIINERYCCELLISICFFIFELSLIEFIPPKTSEIVM